MWINLKPDTLIFLTQTLNVSDAHHMGTLIPDILDNRSNLRTQSYSSLKKGCPKLYDSSLIVVPTSESYKLSEFIRANPESYENLDSIQSVVNSANDLRSCPNEIYVVDNEIRNIHPTTGCDGMKNILTLH